MTASRWLLPEAAPEQAHALAAGLQIHSPLARVLVQRGCTDLSTARSFLCPALTDLLDPMLLLGMPEAVARLRRAIDGREKILLYGDYDVDGTTSVVILKKAIELAGAAAGWFVPNRVKHGYGVHPEIVERAAAEGVKLLISLDTGIRAAEAICLARRVGLDVIVVDHHLPDAQLPPAIILNPRQPGCPYPEKNLCGAGVTFKLVQALLATLDWPSARVERMTASFLKLVAIGTVADVVPLTGENRILVKFGLSGLRTVHNRGLRELMRVAGVREGTAPSAGQIAFRIAPRMNAAGRMADANDVIHLLLSEDDEEARRLAAQLHTLNLQRQETEERIVHQILEECLADPVRDGQAALVFAGRDWHRGVLGIVANRLTERFHRPVIVISEEQGVYQGSGRSIAAFHLLEALESMPELLTRFGGHRQAVGLTLESARLEEFRTRFMKYAAERLSAGDFLPQWKLDACLELSEVTDESIGEILRLAPFGYGNPSPLFAAMDLEVAGPVQILKEKHLRINLKQGGRYLTVRAWNSAGRAHELQPGARIDAVLCFDEDDYSLSRGYPGWSAVLRDFRASLS